MLLDDQAAVVTGAASGIGRATAIECTNHGADVVVADIREEPKEEGAPTAEKIESETDSRAEFVECDITDHDDIMTALDAAEALGGLDIWVNNAGVFHYGNTLEMTREEFDRVANVNIRGTFFATQAAGRRLADRGGGSIVNVASTSGFRASGMIGAYCASKAAVIQLTRAFADELGQAGVRINAVSPGAVDTELARDRSEKEQKELVTSIPLRRVSDPVDIAGSIALLCSDLAGYIHGENVVVDGGLTI